MTSGHGSDALRGALRSAWIEIDLGALDSNLRLMRDRIGPTRILAVVKADAYGHGAGVVSRRLEAAGVDCFGVALAEEGARLRRDGVRSEIVVLGPTTREQRPLFRRHRLTPVLTSPEQLEIWREWSPGAGAPLDVHLEVDSGMGRLGFDPVDATAAVAAVETAPGLRLTGLLSHFASADEVGSPQNESQEEAFRELLATLGDERTAGLSLHLANSAAALHRPSSRFSMARIGLALYGLDPARRENDLTPILSLRTEVSSIREVPEGTPLGYGATWRSSRPSRIAVVPVGYGDGVPWRLGNRGRALVDGRPVPVVGAVSMDLVLLDVTDVDCREGSRVELLGRGRDAEDAPDAWDWADTVGTIPYEILTCLGLRLPRRFVEGGRAVAASSPLIRS